MDAGWERYEQYLNQYQQVLAETASPARQRFFERWLQTSCLPLQAEWSAFAAAQPERAAEIMDAALFHLDEMQKKCARDDSFLGNLVYSAASILRAGMAKAGSPQAAADAR